jgi:hypothetical protein
VKTKNIGKNNEKAQSPQKTTGGRLPNDSSQSVKKPRASAYESWFVTELLESEVPFAVGSGQGWGAQWMGMCRDESDEGT